MKIEQLYTNCLAEAAYYIESEGEAAIIDPIRETTPYTEKITANGVKLKYVFETHFHADFVSGHIDLAKQTGATIVFGPLANTSYKVHNATDGEFFSVGKIKIKALHTPGHTPESTCYLLFDENGKEYCVFTGDTLFVGDVGRPDLLDGTVSKEDLAGMMYESLNKKIKTLSNEVIVYPAHGAGSSCGKNIGKETWSTIGEQKQNNYALKNQSKDDFVKALIEGLGAPPQYFFEDAQINKNGYDNIDVVIKRNLKSLSPSEVKKEIDLGALVLDTRNPEIFEKGFIAGSINIGLNGQYAVWVGTVINIKTPLVIIADEGKEQEAILRLARVGYENVKGFLKGGVSVWNAAGHPVQTIASISADDFAARVKAGEGKVLDVRKVSEYDKGHVKDAQLMELSSLSDNLNELDKSQEYLVHCAGGYRSMIAASIMKANGFEKIKNVYGGFSAIQNTSVEKESSVTV